MELVDKDSPQLYCKIQYFDLYNLQKQLKIPILLVIIKRYIITDIRLN